MSEVQYVGGAVLWPNDLAEQRRIVLAQREAALAEIGHAAGCLCDEACRAHRARIAQLRAQLSLPPAETYDVGLPRC